MKKTEGTRGANVLKLLIITCLLWVSASAFATPSAQVFVSFSLPETLLQETLKESVRLHLPTYLNGLHHNSMRDTIARVTILTQAVPNLNLQIDPTAFERFGINQVPALVVEKNGRLCPFCGRAEVKKI